MTTFCGVFSLDENVSIAEVENILAFTGDDPASIRTTWGSNIIALGQLTVFNTPESFHETLPLYEPDNELTIAGDIRLDNRVELCKQLELPGINTCGDASIVLSAYKKWGKSVAEHLTGDFAFVIWDNKQRKLICCTDHLGSRGIFYYFNGKKFIFASTPNPILQHSEVPHTINLNKLSTIAYPYASQLFWSESWFKNIFPMPAATVMTVSTDGIRKQKYWEPDDTKELNFKSINDFEDSFKDVLFRAIGNRMRSNFPVTASLSGGLDSSAVVSVAAKILEEQNRGLEVFSAVLPDNSDPSLTDERYYIDLFKSFPNVKINYITAPGKGFFSDLETLKTDVYSPNLISRHYLSTAFIKAAQSIGSRVLLNGGGGETGVSFYGTGGYAELFKRMQWRTLGYELKCRKQLTGEPFLRGMYSNVIRPLLPVNFLKKNVIGTGKKRLSCLRDDLAEDIRMHLEPRKHELAKHLSDVSSSHRVNHANLIRLVQKKTRGKVDFGTVDPINPLLDKELLEFCLAIPLEFKIKNGYKRYTVRAGLNGLLPHEIQWRNTKGPFSPDYDARYRAQLPEVRSFLNDILPNDPVRQIVDIDKLKAWTDISLRPGDLPGNIALDVVPEGIYLIHFLRRFPEYRL
ncbi:MAG TPA: asparagine synthase-related protein [Mucilaginibacter sp.]